MFITNLPAAEKNARLSINTEKQGGNESARGSMKSPGMGKGSCGRREVL